MGPVLLFDVGVVVLVAWPRSGEIQLLSGAVLVEGIADELLTVVGVKTPLYSP